MPSIQTVILCGGLGTRLKPLLDGKPKPMVEVAGKPFLERILDHAAGCGFTDFILCTGYRGEQIKDYFAAAPDRTIRFSHEKEALGTGGAVKLAAPMINSGCFFVMNGDSFCALDMKQMLAAHREKGALVTMALLRADSGRKDGGYVETDASGYVTAFSEKVFREGSMLNAGIYLFDKQVLERIPAGRSVSLEKEVFPALCGGELGSFEIREPVYDIGTPERLDAFRSIVREQKRKRGR